MTIKPINIKHPQTGNRQPVTDNVTLTCRNLGKRFSREWIFRKLDYSFERGKVYAITGPNGSGKSTLMQVLWGQSPPTTGSLSYNFNGATVPVEDVYRHMTIATPYMDLVDEFTLAEQVDLHFKLRALQNGITIDQLIEKMYLSEAKNKAIGNFSSGMRQRLKLGLAFHTQGNLIFLDEPGTNLDKKAFNWYLNLLKNRNPETTLFIASNNPEEYPDEAEILNIMDFK